MQNEMLESDYRGEAHFFHTNEKTMTVTSEKQAQDS